MKHAALIAALLLIGCAERLPTHSLDILWQIRSPEEISREAEKQHEMNRLKSSTGVDGLAWYAAEPCRIMTPPLTRATMWILEQEYRHCIEGAFHE